MCCIILYAIIFLHFLRYENDDFKSITVFLRDQYLRDSINKNASSKFLEAARYGKVTGEIAKCEFRYQCSLDLKTIQSLF